MIQVPTESENRKEGRNIYSFELIKMWNDVFYFFLTKRIFTQTMLMKVGCECLHG